MENLRPRVSFIAVHSVCVRVHVGAYPGVEECVQDVVRSGLSSPLQHLRQEEELKTQAGATMIIYHNHKK